MKPQLAIGLMSGTSLDGIDAALVEFHNNANLPKSPALRYFAHFPLPKTWRKRLAQLNNHPQIHLQELAELQLHLGKAFSDAAQKLMQQAQVSPHDICVIGSHGQTLFHAPNLAPPLGMSLQIGHPAIIAKDTGIPVAADFRIDDMALGGQGAPLAPAFHQILFADLIPVWSSIAVINIGGISNLTLLDSHQKILGYDLGPGNGLMDEVCQHFFHCDYDKNGQIAAAGQVDQSLLQQLKQHPFFQQKPPKSTGKETFNFQWLQKFPLPSDPKDLMATLNQLTADLIIDALKTHQAKIAYLCGGGALNTTLMQNIQQGSSLPIYSTQALNIDPMAIEAMLCAWLGLQRLQQNPIDLSQITGSSRPTILGGLWCP